MPTITSIAEMVEVKKGELADLQRRAEIAATELRVWQQAATLVAGSSLNGHAQTTAPRASSVVRSVRDFDGRMSMKGHWRAISQHLISRSLNSFSYGDLEKAGRAVGHEVNRNTARSQMANYTKAGLIERVGDGQFRFTEAGKTAAGALSNSPSAKAEGIEKPVEGGAQATGLFAREDDVQSVVSSEGHYTDHQTHRGE